MSTTNADTDYLTAVEANEQITDLLMMPSPDWNLIAELAGRISAVADRIG
jgi:hypothetical protein